jgi:hypothetical protein
VCVCVCMHVCVCVCVCVCVGGGGGGKSGESGVDTVRSESLLTFEPEIHDGYSFGHHDENVVPLSATPPVTWVGELS